MGTRVYVGNIPFNFSWQEVKDHFKQAGAVIRADLLELPDGRSKGCAIVEYRTEADAQRAIEMLRDSQLGTRQLYVREDREEPSRNYQRGGPPCPSGGPGQQGGGWGGQQRMNGGPPGGMMHQGGGYGGGRGYRQGGYNQGGYGGRSQRPRGQEDPRRIFVTNLPAGTLNDAVRDFFSQYGNVLEVSMIGRGDLEKQSATVAFESEEHARAAMEQGNNAEMDGRTLVVREDRFGASPAQT